MVNAGAIACSGLIYEAEGDGAFELIRKTLSRFAGRELGVDEAVFASERATGDRNRAIAWLLRNYSVVRGDVDAVLDVYFRQCSVLVTARDLAVMAATLANSGVNPLTGERIVTPYAVARTLSVMTSSGMYDYAGEWIYRVGMPAKSGVGGGIVAALPAQLGLGTFSPRLDSHGNSVRGLKVCEALSSQFDLHVLNRSGDVRTCVIADYDIAGVSSRRSRQPHEQQILEERHDEIRVIELVGALTFATIDYVSRQLSGRPAEHAASHSRFPARAEHHQAAARLLGEVSPASPIVASRRSWRASKRRRRSADAIRGWTADAAQAAPVFDCSTTRSNGPRTRSSIAMAVSCALHEDAMSRRAGAARRIERREEIAELAELCASRGYQAGQRIIGAGESATSLFFLQSGMVSVKLHSGVRLASLVPGMAFGEMALIEHARSADVWADTAVQCLELSLSAYAGFRASHPESGERIMRNLATLLARRLILANTKVDLLSAY